VTGLHAPLRYSRTRTTPVFELDLHFLAERYHVTFGLWHEPSVCRLSVTLLRSTHEVEVSGNIFALPNTLGTWAVCTDILGKKFKGGSR